MLNNSNNIERQNAGKQSFSLKRRKKIRLPFNITRHEYKQLVIFQRRGHWSEKEKLKYAVFLQYYKRRFQVKAKRRFSNTFDMMANFIKTRNSHQCRSHHQKMQKEKFKIDVIIENTYSKYHPRVYKELRDQYISQIQALYNDETENFQKFKHKIQKIEEKKEIQRKVSEKNKRILRSDFHKSSSGDFYQANVRQEQFKSQKAAYVNEDLNHLKRASDQQRRQNNFQQRLNRYTQNQSHPLFQKLKIPSNLENFINGKNSCQQILRPPNPIITDSINQKIQLLQQRKQKHLQLARYHFDAYTHQIIIANNCQFEIMKEQSIHGKFYPI